MKAQLNMESNGGGRFPATFDDWILTKNNHEAIMMIEKIKKHIIYSAEDKVLNIDQKDIEQYLSEVKDAVEKDNYRLDRNARRQDNINLFLDYVIDEAKAKEIILSLTVMDFSETLQNKHKGYEHGKLYVFECISRLSATMASPTGSASSLRKSRPMPKSS